MAGPLLSLAVTVTSEQHVEFVLRKIVDGPASQPGVALVRIWLVPSVHIPNAWQEGAHYENEIEHLRLVASAGKPIRSPGEDWSFLQGRFSRFPLNIGKVGQVAADRQPIFIKDFAPQDTWVVRPEWAEREEIRSFAGHPLIFQEELLGVIGLFSRRPLDEQEFTWLTASATLRVMPRLNDIKTWTGRLGHSHLRSFTDKQGHFWLEQNPEKRSKWAKLARQGHEIAWEFEGSAYTGRMLIDGEIYTPSEATKKFLKA